MIIPILTTGFMKSSCNLVNTISDWAPWSTESCKASFTGPFISLFKETSLNVAYSKILKNYRIPRRTIDKIEFYTSKERFRSNSLHEGTRPASFHFRQDIIEIDVIGNFGDHCLRVHPQHRGRFPALRFYGIFRLLSHVIDLLVPLGVHHALSSENTSTEKSV